MRTTVTLDADVAALLQNRMRDRGESFKVALNDSLRSALAPQGGERFATPTRSMGPPSVPLDKALALAAAIEDEELARRLATGR